MTQNIPEYFNNALPVHTLMACGMSEFIAPFIHNLGTSWRLAETAIITYFISLNYQYQHMHNFNVTG